MALRSGSSHAHPTDWMSTHMRTKRSQTVQRDMDSLQETQPVTRVLGSNGSKGRLESILEGHIDGTARLKVLQQRVVPASQIEWAYKQNQSFLRSLSSSGHTRVIPVNDLREEEYSVAESNARCKLASLYRLIDWFGWSQLIFNHISLRAPGEQEEFLLNAFGLHYSEVTASNLVKVDIDGNIIDPGTTQLGISKAGYTIHSAIHGARKDIRCIIHVHTPAGAAVSAMACGLLPLCQEAMSFGGVSYHKYTGIIVDKKEKDTLVADLGPINQVMILQNHGLLAMGSTVEDAFQTCYNVIRACETQVQAFSAGYNNVIAVTDDVAKLVMQVSRRSGGGVSCHDEFECGQLEFEAMMRLLDNMGHMTGYPYRANKLLRPLIGSKEKTDDDQEPEGEIQVLIKKIRREIRRIREEKERRALHTTFPQTQVGKRNMASETLQPHTAIATVPMTTSISMSPTAPSISMSLTGPGMGPTHSGISMAPTGPGMSLSAASIGMNPSGTGSIPLTRGSQITAAVKTEPVTAAGQYGAGASLYTAGMESSSKFQEPRSKDWSFLDKRIAQSSPTGFRKNVKDPSYSQSTSFLLTHQPMSSTAYTPASLLITHQPMSSITYTPASLPLTHQPMSSTAYTPASLPLTHQPVPAITYTPASLPITHQPMSSTAYTPASLPLTHQPVPAISTTYTPVSLPLTHQPVPAATFSPASLSTHLPMSLPSTHQPVSTYENASSKSFVNKHSTSHHQRKPDTPKQRLSMVVEDSSSSSSSTSLTRSPKAAGRAAGEEEKRKQFTVPKSKEQSPDKLAYHKQEIKNRHYKQKHSTASSGSNKQPSTASSSSSEALQSLVTAPGQQSFVDGQQTLVDGLVMESDELSGLDKAIHTAVQVAQSTGESLEKLSKSLNQSND